jgi:arabinogalactan oligomer/maltooligosaccharide transport system permease protein
MHKKFDEVFQQIGMHIILISITIVVLIPIVWILSMALDPREIDKPLTLTIIPPGASFKSFDKLLFGDKKIICSPSSELKGATVCKQVRISFELLCKDSFDPKTCPTFGHLLGNSLLVALGTSVIAVILGSSAAYAFARFKFIGRQVGMLFFIILLMLPATATIASLYALLSQIKIGSESLVRTLPGLMIAYASGGLPFAIWNLKGYFDTIPKELEEAALIDGCTVTESFFRIIMPLSLPALAITVLFSFMSGWTEFVMAVIFLSDSNRYTLAIALNSMQGQYSTPWSEFAAMSILMSIPIVILFFALQRFLISGMTVGGVKG